MRGLLQILDAGCLRLDVRLVAIAWIAIVGLSGTVPCTAAGQAGSGARWEVREAHLVDPAGKTPGHSGVRDELGTVDPVSQPGQKAWTSLLDDDFESGFPGATWSVRADGTDAVWEDWTCWSTSGTHSVGCAVSGSAAITCGQDYPSGMQSWMTAGPFDLSDASYLDAVFEFYLNLNTEPNSGSEYRDYLFVGASIDGTNYNGFNYAGTLLQTLQLDLTAVPVEGNLLGEAQVWVALVFVSDASTNLAGGAQIDDAVLAVDQTVNQVPVVTVTDPVGGESLTIGSSYRISYTAVDPDAGPSSLGVSIDYSTNSGSIWTPIVSGQPNEGTYDWMVPDEATTTGRIRVRATDGADEGEGVSSSDFSIISNVEPTVTLLSPNGGESLAANATTTVTWTATDPDAAPRELQISLEYTTDDGANWFPIDSGLANTGSLAWTAPEVTTTQAKLRISAWDGSATAVDESDAVFSIALAYSDLTLGDASGPSGTTVTVALALDNVADVGGLQADLFFDGSKAFLTGFEAVGRASGMAAEARQTGENQARILLYYDSDDQLATGSGDVAELEFTLQGPGGGTTTLQLSDVVLSDAVGIALPVTLTDGELSVEQPQDAPVLQISVLKNPARPRTMQILVRVANGSGDAPTVTAGGANLSLTSLGQAVYRGEYSAADNAATVTIAASDTNIRGIGNAQITVALP